MSLKPALKHANQARVEVRLSITGFLIKSTDLDPISDNPIVVDDTMKICHDDKLTKSEFADAQTPLLSSTGETFTNKDDELDQKTNDRAALTPREVSGKDCSIYSPASR